MFANETIQWSPGVTLELIEKQVILKAFQFYRGRKTETANALGITVKTLENKLNKFEADAEIWKAKEKNATAQRELFLARQRGINTPNNVEGHRPPEQPSAPTGIRVESVANTSSEHEMPMPQRAQVQTVLPKQASQGGFKKSR